MRDATDGHDHAGAFGGSDDDPTVLLERSVGAFATVDDHGDRSVDSGGGIIVDVTLQDA